MFLIEINFFSEVGFVPTLFVIQMEKRKFTSQTIPRDNFLIILPNDCKRSGKCQFISSAFTSMSALKLAESRARDYSANSAHVERKKYWMLITCVR